MRVRTAVMIGLLTLFPVSTFAGEQETLETLADQAFLKLHDYTVTLPDQSTERVARSTTRLPLGWPMGQPKGLVEEQFIHSAFQTVGLDGLDLGKLVVFQMPDEWEVWVIFHRDHNGEINIKHHDACDVGECIAIHTNTCEDGEGTTNCRCTTEDCNQCQGEDGEYSHDQEGEPEAGNTFTHMQESEDTREVCGIGSVGGAEYVVLF